MDAARAYWDAAVTVAPGTLTSALAREEDELVRGWLWIALALRHPRHLPPTPPNESVEDWKEADGVALALLVAGRPEAGEWLDEILGAGYMPELRMMSTRVSQVLRSLPKAARPRVAEAFGAAVERALAEAELDEEPRAALVRLRACASHRVRPPRP